MLATNDQILFTLNWFEERHKRAAQINTSKPFSVTTKHFKANKALIIYQSLKIKYSK